MKVVMTITNGRPVKTRRVPQRTPALTDTVRLRVKTSSFANILPALPSGRRPFDHAQAGSNE